MFIRERKRRNQDGSVTVYLQWVENRRVDGKIRQRVLATLGRTDDPQLASGLGSLVETASRYAQIERIRLTDQARAETRIWGAALVWGKLWSETFGPILRDVGWTDRWAHAVYLMVLHRLVDPGSKCAALRFAHDVYGRRSKGWRCTTCTARWISWRQARKRSRRRGSRDTTTCSPTRISCTSTRPRPTWKGRIRRSWRRLATHGTIVGTVAKWGSEW